MNYHELIIDGVSVDMPDDADITLDIKSNLFSDISEMVTNSSYTITIPKTVRNLTLLGNCDKIGSDTDVPYTFHDCEYRHNGVPVIQHGRATVTECEDAISINIYWGLFPFLEKLISEDKNLNELSSSLHILFNRKNELTPYATMLQQGYGYADYYPYQYGENEKNEWTSMSIPQVETTTTQYELTDGKVYTGEEAGGSASGGVIDDEYYQCLVIPFVAGNTATIYNVVGQGENRAYAVIDGSGKVLQLADETQNTGTSRADINAEAASDFFSDEYLFPLINSEMTVTTVDVRIQAHAVQGTLEYGIIGLSPFEATQLGTVDVPPSDEDKIITIDVNQEKPAGKYFYIRQAEQANHFLMGYPDLTGQSDLGRYSKLTGYDQSSKYNVCFVVHYESTTPVPQTYIVQGTLSSAKLLVNNDKRYSSNAVVVVDSSNAITSLPSDAFGLKDPLQPVVTCWWIMQQIMSDYGITFDWGSSVSDAIKQLAVPVIERQADAETIQGELLCSINNATQLGLLMLNATEKPTSITLSDDRTELHVTTECTLTFEVYAYVEFSMANAKPTGSTTITSIDGVEITRDIYHTASDYIKMTVKHRENSGEDPDEYIIGRKTSDMTIYSDEIVDKKYTTLISGTGKLDLLEDDVITFELCNDVGRHISLLCRDGVVNASLEQSEEVPYGGMFPIAKNLPDISITDYIKMLALLTGTFPMQKFEGNTVKFVAYDSLWENKVRALDWSRKLIASGMRNKPREIEYNVEGYYQHNYYRWKEDDETKGKYDADIHINNETLEAENETWEMPFAASDGNRVPIYTERKSLSGTFGGSNRDNATSTSTEDAGGTYSACEPRIMNLSANSEGNAELNFNINLPQIFATKYAKLINAVTKAVVITEHVNLTDLEILNFDETVPVYFAQYGAYFAVLEIKVTSGGYSEVKMIKIEI